MIKMLSRNLMKNKTTSGINILGLALGLVTVLLIYLYISHETGYDRYHKDADRIYRVGLSIGNDASDRDYALNVPPLGPALKEQFPQVEESARVLSFFDRVHVRFEEKTFYEDLMLYADPSIFQVLTLPLVSGNAENALRDPNSIVISQSIARKYFGDSDPLGQVLKVDKKDYTVSAVIKDAPQQTHLPYNMFVSIHQLDRMPWMQDWNWPGVYTYVKLDKAVDRDDFARALTAFAETHTSRDPSGDNRYSYILQPIRDIHLHSNLEYEFTPMGNLQRLYMFGGIGLLVLFTAMFNYINLTTARAVKRSKEISIRRVVGADRKQLVVQFFLESLTVLLIALALALLAATILLPMLGSWLSLDMNISDLLTPKNGIVVLLISVLTGLLIGLYPSLLISSYKPVTLIKGGMMRTSHGLGIRRVLVTLQFTVSVLLIIGTLVVGGQIRFMKNRDAGFDKTQKLVIPVQGIRAMEGNYESLKSGFMRIPDVLGAAASASVPGEGAGSMMTSLVGQSNDKTQMVYYAFWDKDFQSLYDIKLVAGRTFDKNITSDEQSVCLVNEAALSAFGWSNASEALGKRIREGMMQRELEIVGVIRDYNYLGAQYKVDPLLVQILPSTFSHITLKVTTRDPDALLNKVKETWTEFYPDKPFEYYFLDESFERLYHAEELAGRLVQIFTLLALVISGMGIWGLVTFAAEQKTKETGVRKVLGASIPHIIYGLLKDILKGMLVANVIAWPVAFWLLNNWLEGYAYRISLQWWMFALSGMLALVIALLTTSAQVIRAATADPVKALRYE